MGGATTTVAARVTTRVHSDGGVESEGEGDGGNAQAAACKADLGDYRNLGMCISHGGAEAGTQEHGNSNGAPWPTQTEFDARQQGPPDHAQGGGQAD